MNTLSTQVLYNWGGSPKGIPVAVGEKSHQVVSLEDFQRALGTAETAFGQKLLADNQDSQRVANLIADAGLTELDTGTATTSDVAAEVNKLYNILTNLVAVSKVRG